MQVLIPPDADRFSDSFVIYQILTKHCIRTFDAMHDSRNNSACLVLLNKAFFLLFQINFLNSLEGELNPKIKFVIFERTLKITE